MKSPIVKLYIKKNQRDLSDRVERFRYEESTEKDDLVTIDIKSGYAFELADDADIVAGTIIQFQYGFAGEKLSPVKTARITNVDMEYGERIKMTIKALDMGNVMKKSSSQTVWKNTTSGEIVQQIADKYGLSVEIEGANRQIKSLAQGNKSDYEVLQEMVKEESNGSYMFYIKSGTIHYVKKSTALKKAAKSAYRYGDNIIKFIPKLKEAEQSGAGTKTEVKNVNPFTLETITGSADKETVKEDVAMGANGVSVDAFGNATKKIISSPLPTEDKNSGKNEANNKANYKKKAGTYKGLTATLVVEGNPVITTTDIITIENVAKRHEGNWYVEKVVHDISNTYTTTVELNKNGTNKATKTNGGTNKDINKTQGDKDSKPTKKLPYVDAYGGGHNFTN